MTITSSDGDTTTGEQRTLQRSAKRGSHPEHPCPCQPLHLGLGWSLLPCSNSTRCSQAPWSWLLDPSGSEKGKNWFRSQGEKPCNPFALQSHRCTAARGERCCASPQSHIFHTLGTRLFSRNWQMKLCETNKATGWANPAFTVSYFPSADHYVPNFWSKCNVPMRQEKGKLFKNNWLSQKHLIRKSGSTPFAFFRSV